MLMRPNKAETAVHGCHCPDVMAVRMRKALTRPWVGVRVCHLLLLSFYENSITFADRKYEELSNQSLNIPPREYPGSPGI